MHMLHFDKFPWCRHLTTLLLRVTSVVLSSDPNSVARLTLFNETELQGKGGYGKYRYEKIKLFTSDDDADNKNDDFNSSY